MTDTDTALILAELRSLRSDVAAALAGRPLPDMATRDFLRAVDTEWGNGPFRAGELLKWAADEAFAGRRAVLDAARVLIGTRGEPSAHALGLKLAQIASKVADGLHVERIDVTERGSQLWAVLPVRG